VGFALETEADPGPAAQEKLRAKGLDLVVANRVGPETGPERATNQVSIWNEQGLVQSTEVLPKPAIAEIVLDAVESELTRRSAAAKT
jgi:phosphopantothenoylcysteine decarboxylase/phosphopantothenate--cysteine ligase